MRRTIGAVGATLAVAAAIVTSAASAGAATADAPEFGFDVSAQKAAAPAHLTGVGISGDGIEQDDLVGASLTSQPGGDLFGVEFSDYGGSDAVGIVCEPCGIDGGTGTELLF